MAAEANETKNGLRQEGKEEEEVAVSDRRIFRKTSLCMHDVHNSGLENDIEKIFILVVKEA